MSNAEYLLSTLELLERKAAVLADSQPASNVVFVTFPLRRVSHNTSGNNRAGRQQTHGCPGEMEAVD